MKVKYFFAFVGLMLFFVNNLNAQMTGAELQQMLQQMYVSYLGEQGYQHSIDSDGDVAFKAEGWNFYISVDENDLDVFTIVLPNFWEIESTNERREALLAASNANRTIKIAKIFLTTADNTSVIGQTFLAKPDDFRLFFRRMINMMLLVRRKFVEEMQGGV